MARLHSKKRGKSKSRKPRVIERTNTKYPDSEIKEKILELAKKGIRTSEIGAIMRDKYGIGNLRIILGKRLVAFLREEKASPEYPQDLLDLIKRAIKMRNHLKNRKTDKHNSAKLLHVESKIHRLVKYYKKEKIIPTGWKYDPESAVLMLK